MTIDAFLAALEYAATPMQAARDAGYAPADCARVAVEFMKDERAKAILNKRTSITTPTPPPEYSTDAAMKEAEDAMGFAILTENAGAYIKAVELRSKLKGLLVDKLDVRQAVGFQIRIQGLDEITSPPPPTPLPPPQQSVQLQPRSQSQPTLPPSDKRGSPFSPIDPFDAELPDPFEGL